MEIEMSHMIWNVILTLVLAPLAWWVRSTHDEMRRILDQLEKLNDKLDRIQEAAAKEYRL